MKAVMAKKVGINASAVNVAGLNWFGRISCCPVKAANAHPAAQYSAIPQGDVFRKRGGRDEFAIHKGDAHD